MKKSYLFPLVLAGLMLGACSNDDWQEQGNNNVLPGEKGYINLSVNLPTTTGSRALNGYEDGTSDEYDVKNAKLLIFAGNSEADATCHSIYDLDISAFLGNTEAQITSTAELVAAITRPDAGTIYALVVLNDNGLITEAMQGRTFSSFYTTGNTLAASALNNNGFFMANAPLYSKAGGTGNPADGTVSTLSVIDPAKIYSTRAEALSSPAATVYVERALSKVTLTGNSTLSPDHNSHITAYVINGWTLDNTNRSTYLVRNVAPTTAWWTYQNGTAGYRFVDSSPVRSGVSLYRTHFGIDPNYTAAYDAANFQSVGKNPASLTPADGETPAYCLENTFDVAHMTEQHTTRAVIAAKLTVTGAEDTSGDFYLLNNNSNVIYQQSAVLDEVKRLWMLHLDQIIDTYVKSGTFTEGDVAVTLGNQTNGGFVQVAALVMSESGTIEYQDGQNLASLNAAAAAYIPTINNMLQIAYYKGGVAYYPVLIKHFGNEETPWDTSKIQNGNSYPGSDAENNWLGRYGVLRNTWYQLNVTSLKNIGSPEVPDVTTEYDDPGKQYISVEINILPWAVRTQNVEL